MVMIIYDDEDDEEGSCQVLHAGHHDYDEEYDDDFNWQLAR